MMISLEYKILKSLNILTLYGTYKNNNDYISVDYRIGSKLKLTDNIDLLLGKSTFSKLSMGFSISNDLFNMDYSYIISNNDLPFDDSYNIGIGVNIPKLSKKSKELYP